jgi:hypothetical protein
MSNVAIAGCADESDDRPMTDYEFAIFHAKLIDEMETEEAANGLLHTTDEMSDEEFDAFIKGIEVDMGTVDKEKIFERR